MKSKRSAKQKKTSKERKANCWTEDNIQEALHKLKSVPGSK